MNFRGCLFKETVWKQWKQLQLPLFPANSSENVEKKLKKNYFFLKWKQFGNSFMFGNSLGNSFSVKMRFWGCSWKQFGVLETVLYFGNSFGCA